MSHNEFEQLMKGIKARTADVWLAETNSFYNVSDESAVQLQIAHDALMNAAARMSDDLE